MDAPNWLTKDYIEQALRKFHNDANLKIIKFDMNAALGKGENFGGILNRVRVQYQMKGEMQTKRFIVKTSFESDEFLKEKMKDYDIFKREMSIYENVLPKLNQLLLEINDADKLFATAIHVDYDRQALIFEDLSERDYVMAERTAGLDMQHVKLILRKLAKMHATSAVLNEREHGILETYDRGFFNRYTDTYRTYFVNCLVACGKFLLQWGDPEYEYYGRKLLALEPYYMEIGKRCFAPTPEHVNVFAHGDVWTNNVMFQYDPKTDEPLDVIIIDFQYSFWGSPTLDLHHFFNTSLKEPLRLHKQDILFQYYHDIFADTLRKLNYRKHPVPDLHLFLRHAEEKRFFAFHSSCVIQPVMINEDTEDADFNALMAEDERANNFKTKLYKNPKVQENLKNLLPMFDQKGLLDINQYDVCVRE